jgi:predicted aldo/keto reductase-like oxidoreductase
MKKLGFGMMRLPITEEGNPKSVDQELVNRMADYFLEKGFTYFDTAYPYHKGISEVAAKIALVERHPRDSFTLTDKMPTFLVTKNEDYQQIFDKQLQRCGVDYFDYYLLHYVGEINYASTLQNGGFEFVRDLQAKGKVKRIGLSYHDKAELLDRILYGPPEKEYVQLQINYADWDNEPSSRANATRWRSSIRKKVIVMELSRAMPLPRCPRKRTSFSVNTARLQSASWAVRFAASLDNVFYGSERDELLRAGSRITQVI